MPRASAGKVWRIELELGVKSIDLHCWSVLSRIWNGRVGVGGWEKSRKCGGARLQDSSNRNERDRRTHTSLRFRQRSPTKPAVALWGRGGFGGSQTSSLKPPSIGKTVFRARERAWKTVLFSPSWFGCSDLISLILLTYSYVNMHHH
jgi:hypothetical protein